MLESLQLGSRARSSTRLQRSARPRPRHAAICRRNVRRLFQRAIVCATEGASGPVFCLGLKFVVVDTTQRWTAAQRRSGRSPAMALEGSRDGGEGAKGNTLGTFLHGLPLSRFPCRPPFAR
ncbi:hypothetical protein MRX96_039909 [Rhipicephalus microplus]